MEKLINEFSIGLFFWQSVLFLLLLFLLRKYAWKPILKAVNDREEGIKKALESAEEAKKEMANLQADNEKLLQEARLERDAMLKEARTLKSKIIGEAKDEAQIEADKIVAQANLTIEAEKKAALAEIKGQVAEISLSIAEKVVKKELSEPQKQQELVQTLLNEAKLN